MTTLHLPNLQQNIVNTFLIINMSTSDNLNKFWVVNFVSFPQLEELISPHMCRPKPHIDEEKQVVDVLYISGRFSSCDLHSRHKNI